jgi:hypothetical protein
LEVFLGLTENVEPVRHRHPLGSVDEFLCGTKTLLLVACDSQVDIDVINSQCAVPRKFFDVVVVLENGTIGF